LRAARPCGRRERVRASVAVRRAQIRRMRWTRWRRGPEPGSRAARTNCATRCAPSSSGWVSSTAGAGATSAASRASSTRAPGSVARLVPLAQQDGVRSCGVAAGGAVGGRPASAVDATSAAGCAGQRTAPAAAGVACRSTPHRRLACASPATSSATRTTSAIEARSRKRRARFARPAWGLSVAVDTLLISKSRSHLRATETNVTPALSWDATNAMRFSSNGLEPNLAWLPTRDEHEEPRRDAQHTASARIGPHALAKARAHPTPPRRKPSTRRNRPDHDANRR
jgi:hypothetical protein